MSYRVPHIANGVVVNISFSAAPGEIDGTNANIGDLYIDGQFVSPPRDLAKEKQQKLSQLEAKRVAKSETGLMWNGKAVPTDKAALALLLSAEKYLTRHPERTIKRAGLGVLDLATVQALIDTVGDQHKLAFDREADLFDLITGCETVEQLDTIDIEAGW